MKRSRPDSVSPHPSRPPRGAAALPLLAGLLLLWAAPAPLAAHEVSSASLVAHIDTSAKRYVLDAAMEVVPSEDDELNDEIPPELAARLFAEEYLVTLFDEVPQTPSIEITLEDASDEDTPAELRRQQVVAQMAGDIPEDAEEFLLYLDPLCPMAVVMVVIKDDRPSRRMQVVLPGEFSRPVNVQPVLEEDPFEPAAEGRPAAPAPEAAPPEGRRAAKGAASSFAAGWRSYFSPPPLPLLLLAGALLLSTRGRAVLWQVAALLLAQALALAAVMWTPWLPPSWTGTALALLVAALSLEAVLHREMKLWRLPLLAAAGLLAGLALAGTAEFRALFPEAGTEDAAPAELLASFSFLAGVEAALVACGIVVGALLLALQRFRRYRQLVVHPLAALIAAYCLFIVVEGWF